MHVYQNETILCNQKVTLKLIWHSKIPLQFEINLFAYLKSSHVKIIRECFFFPAYFNNLWKYNEYLHVDYIYIYEIKNYNLRNNWFSMDK